MGEVHLVGVGAVVEIDSTVLNFKRLGMRFNIPEREGNVMDAGQHEGNKITLPDEEIVVNFTAYVTAANQAGVLAALIRNITELEYTEGGTGATVHTFYEGRGSGDFSSAEEGDTIDFSVKFQGYKQGSWEYGYIPAP